MREILFRGKRTYNGEWVYGNLHLQKNVKNGKIEEAIIYSQGISIKGVGEPIDSETVGQYMGLTDINGKRIFEGDIIEYNNGKGYVGWSDSNVSWMCVEEKGEYWEWFGNMGCVEVVSNIHDNPELLEGRE